jgi:hypothetical protein
MSLETDFDAFGVLRVRHTLQWTGGLRGGPLFEWKTWDDMMLSGIYKIFRYPETNIYADNLADMWIC